MAKKRHPGQSLTAEQKELIEREYPKKKGEPGYMEIKELAELVGVKKELMEKYAHWKGLYRRMGFKFKANSQWKQRTTGKRVKRRRRRDVEVVSGPEVTAELADAIIRPHRHSPNGVSGEYFMLLMDGRGSGIRVALAESGSIHHLTKKLFDLIEE